MLVLFTDFGWSDPYVGQLKAALASRVPALPIVDLLHGVPDFNAHAGAQLLAALQDGFPLGSVFVCVVDPGVGGPRQAVVVEADGRWFVGPDNGLLSIVAIRAAKSRCWRIDWRPAELSASFHGRDLFAPIAAEIAAQSFPDDKLTPIAALEVEFAAADLPRVVYVDHYGNAWTGIRGGLMADLAEIEIKGARVPYRPVFHAAAKGEVFWYVNSAGLVEIAANRTSAAARLGIAVGDPVRLPVLPGNRSH